MRNIHWLALSGLLMLVTGGLMMFANSESLPLWAVWFVGPLLWYVGFGVAVSGFAAHFFMAPKRHDDTIRVLQLKRVDTHAPAGVSREIPAMGGFIL